MATKSKRMKHAKPKSLSHGRPPTAKPVVRSISSKATRKLIRTHHTLEKRKAKAISEGDEVTASAIAHEISLQGGIEAYQRASLIGQRNDRGGDSSKVLMEWLDSVAALLKEHALRGSPLKMLEVGALSINNACSKSRLFEMERIDLNSQAEGIKQQDFMERPLPKDSSDQFDIISLSLVLNYVPDAVGKGNMLLRTLKFLKEPNESAGLGRSFPSLFLVLPAPCVLNSRYMDEKKLETIMESLGYALTEKKLSNKLIYYLWRKGSSVEKQASCFKKVEIKTGRDRNNFAIVLK